jgi:hypothetical protein
LFERERIMLAKTEVTRGVVGRYGETYAYSCGRLNVRWKRYSLLYKVFDRTRSQRKQHRLKLRLKVHCDSLIFYRWNQYMSSMSTLDSILFVAQAVGEAPLLVVQAQ